MTKLFKTLGVLPFLLAVFLNTVVDLGHKIVIQNTIFKVYTGTEQVVLTAIVNALILLPFILVFSPAGFLVDKYPKVRVMRATAWGAVVLTTAITFSYWLGWFWLAFAMTFLLAVQSAIYSPAKLSYIKLLFGKEKLAQGNGLVQAISIIGVLFGTLIFSVLFELWYPANMLDKGNILTALLPVGFILIAVSVFELIMMYRLPQFETQSAEAHFDTAAYLSGRMAWRNLQPVLARRVILQSIIGLAMFWSIGQVLLAAFPAFAKAQTGEMNTIIIQAVLAASGIGIALGSILAARISRNYIETGLVPLGAAGIALGLFVLPELTSFPLMGLTFLWIGFMGGLFIVPLNALIQFHAGQTIGRMLAASNLLQNIAMLSFLLLTVACAILGISSQQLLLVVAIIALFGFAYTVAQIPQTFARFILSRLLRSRYKVNVQGMKNLPNEGGVLLLGNHISWVDWAIVQIACPRPVRFVMIRSIYERWYLKWFFKLFGCVPIEAGPSSAKSLETVQGLLDAGQVVCLFPEGAISRNGHLGEFRRGYEKAAKAAKDNVVIVPFYLRGLWGSQFSRSSAALKKVRRSKTRRELLVAFGAPLEKDTDAEVLKRRVFDLSIHAWLDFAQQMPTLSSAWIDTVKRNSSALAIADTIAPALTAERALVGAILFAKRIASISSEKNIGMLLPTSSGGVIANMATLLAGKTIVNLNYTASSNAISSALEQADLQTVYTSKRFIDKLNKRGIDLLPHLGSVKVIYLEELKEQIQGLEKLKTLLAVKLLPAWCLKALYNRSRDSSQAAAILFSSGSEGLPKGIQLSHQNFMANLKQAAEVLNTEEQDAVMASLPLFHAFGLTVTQFMPLIEGFPMVCHADPTDGSGIAKAVAQYKATIMFGTATFFRLYTRDKKIQPLMFDSLRIVIAGAEKLNAEVRDAFKLKFGKTVYEGYGVTETSPVASVNLPDTLDTDYWRVQLSNKVGTVGMPFPGTSFKIVDPASYEELAANEDGMILIGGPQVMMGYLKNPEKTAKVIREIDGVRWYETGDKGHLDQDGFLSIVDRYSRFAKLGGEMVSLSEVELNVRTCMDLQEVELVATNIPDAKKGEQIILLIEQELALSDLKKAMISANCNPLLIPNQVIVVEAVPKLGSGKTDFANAKSLALASINA